MIGEKTPFILLPVNCDIDYAREATADFVRQFKDGKLDGHRNDVALVLSGSIINHCNGCLRVKRAVLKLCKYSKVVICYRVEPWQKASLVSMMRAKHGPDLVTLAVGDGSNDVPMLQTAHIGVGISGISEDDIRVRGNEAACVADYAVAEFRGISRLLFVHGAWNATRMAVMTHYFFYKNICFYLAQLWFALYTRWSGQARIIILLRTFVSPIHVNSSRSCSRSQPSPCTTSCSPRCHRSCSVSAAARRPPPTSTTGRPTSAGLPSSSGCCRQSTTLSSHSIQPTTSPSRGTSRRKRIE